MLTVKTTLELSPTLEQRVEQRQQLKIEIKRLQEECDGIDKELLTAMGVDLDGLKVQAKEIGLSDEELKAYIETLHLEAGRFEVALTGFVRETLNDKKLLEAGVTVEQLKRGKVPTPVVYPRVTEREEEKG